MTMGKVVNSVNSVVHVGWGRDSWKISGTWALCTLDKVVC